MSARTNALPTAYWQLIIDNYCSSIMVALIFTTRLGQPRKQETMSLKCPRSAVALLAVLSLPTIFANLSCNRKNPADEGIPHKGDYPLAYTYAFP